MVVVVLLLVVVVEGGSSMSMVWVGMGGVGGLEMVS